MSRRQLSFLTFCLLGALITLMLAAPALGQAKHGLRGEYFANKSLANLKLTRIDPQLDFAWGEGAPDAALGANTFSARWTGWVVPRYSETYTLITRSDDGVRLWLDDQLLIDNWTAHLVTQDQGRIALQAGAQYAIKIEYYDNTGPAELSLRWHSASQPLEIIPRSQLLPAEVGAKAATATRDSAPSAATLPAVTPISVLSTTGVNGLQGEYFGSKYLTSLNLTRIDPNIYFNWLEGAPAPSMSINTFSVRWTGSIVPRYSESYTFITRSDDGVRLWVNGQQVINNWTDHLETQDVGTIALTAGVAYPFKLEYYDNLGPSLITLRWRSASQALEVVPQSQLLAPGSGASPTPTRTNTRLPTPTRTNTVLATQTRTATFSASATPTRTNTIPATPTRTNTIPATPTRTNTIPVTPTLTALLTKTPTFSASATRTLTRSATPLVSMTPTVNPTATRTPTTSAGRQNGLQGEYFGSKYLTSLNLTRIDPNIYFNWLEGAPAPSMSINTFSVRWTGSIVPRYSESYTFITRSDDGVRLWVNGQQVINNWTDHLETQDVGTIALTAGVAYPFKLEYYDNLGPSLITLRWRSASQALEVVPQSQLLAPGSGASPTPTRTNTALVTPTLTRTNTVLVTATPTRTNTVFATGTLTAMPSKTPTPALTALPTRTRTATPTEVAINSPFFGVDFGIGAIIVNPTAVALAQISGASRVRASVNWSRIEPTEGTFDFASTDLAFNNIINAGFSPVIYMTDNPAWIANTPCGPIDTNNSAKLAAFTTFIATLVARYPNVRTWALYNEPDNAAYVWNGYSSGGCFGDHNNKDLNGNGVNDRWDYARMLAAAWKAVHKANPQAELGIGAVAYDYFDPSAPPWYPNGSGHFNYQFLPELFAYMQGHPLPNGEKYADLMFFNYFDYFGWIWQQVAAGQGIQAKAQALRDVMGQYGQSFPLLVTESGADSRKVGLQGQANCLTMTMVRGKVAGLRSILWWTFKDNPAANQYYGLVDPNFVPKPSYSAFQTAGRELTGFRYNATLSNTTGLKNIEAYEFKDGTDTKLTLWASAIDQWNSEAPCASTRFNQTAVLGPNVIRLRVADVLGPESIVNDNGTGDLDARAGYLSIPIGANPRFVEAEYSLTPIPTATLTSTPTLVRTATRTPTRTPTRAVNVSANP